jgi:hypothetical protein
MAGEDLSLPIERKMIAILGDQDVRDQAGRRHSLGDRPFRCRCLVDRSAGPAAVLWPPDSNDLELRRYPIQHLTDALADRMERTAAAGAGPVRLENELFARQMIGQFAGRLCFLRKFRRDRFRHRAARVRTPDVGAEIVNTELELVWIETFGAPAELQTLELFQDQAEPFGLGFRLG